MWIGLCVVVAAGCSIQHHPFRPEADAAVDAPTVNFRALAYLKDPTPAANDNFGYSVAMSGDADILAVGAIQGSAAGYVDVFQRRGEGWSFWQRLSTGDASFGCSLALSDNGYTLVVGALGAANNAGAAYVFTNNTASWTNHGALPVPSPASFDGIGHSVAVNADGSKIVVGARGDSSNAGAAHVFMRLGAVPNWAHSAKLLPEAPSAFGESVAISHDGSTIAVGTAAGVTYAFVDGVQAPVISAGGNRVALSGDGTTLATASRTYGGFGAAFIYTRDAAGWLQRETISASNPYIPPGPTGIFAFGSSLALSANGSVLAVGAFGESSNATGVNGDQLDHSAKNAGAAYVFRRSGDTSAQTDYVKATNTDAFDGFAGYSLALDATGAMLLVGAPYESSNGDPTNNDASGAGAAYLYGP